MGMIQSAFNQILTSAGSVGIAKKYFPIIPADEPTKEEMEKAEQAQEHYEQEHQESQAFQEHMQKAIEAGGPLEESAFGGPSSVFIDPQSQKALETYTDIIRKKTIQKAGFKERQEIFKAAKDEGIISGKQYKSIICKMKGGTNNGTKE